MSNLLKPLGALEKTPANKNAVTVPPEIKKTIDEIVETEGQDLLKNLPE